MKYIAFDLIEKEFELAETEEKAKGIAEGYLEFYRVDAAVDGWPEDIVGKVGYAEVRESTKVTKTEKREDNPDDWSYQYDEIWHVDLVGTDKAEAEVRELRAANRELQSLFDLQHRRSQEAIQLWQTATGEHNMVPDLGRLLDWLMNQTGLVGRRNEPPPREEEV